MNTGAFISNISYSYVMCNYVQYFYNIRTSLLMGYNSGSNDYYYLLMDENLNIIKVADEQYQYCVTNGSSCSGNCIGSSPVVLSSCYYIAPFTMFLINNLVTPVTKTAANTMKISYSLTW